MSVGRQSRLHRVSETATEAQLFTESEERMLRQGKNMTYFTF